MQVLVFGAGAIGSVLGGFLARAGHEVTLVGRPWHLDAVKAHGLRITGLWGTHIVTGLRTATRLADAGPPSAYAWVLLTVKAHQTDAAARELAAWLPARALLCALQNGLGNYEALIRHLDPVRVALGRVIFGVELEPGSAHVTVCADDVLLGAPDRRFPAKPLAELCAALREAGIPCRLTDDIQGALWSKVLYNCALNGLSTVLEVPYGGLLDHPIASGFMRRVIDEAYRVAGARGVRLEPPDAAAYLTRLTTTLIPATASHRSSMLQDLQRGKPTEIDAMNGAIVRLGLQAGVPAPANTLITRLVHEKERFAGVSPIL